MNKITLHQSSIIKGIAIVLVMLHHFAQAPNSLWLLKPFIAVGPIAVSAFYFVSGYGLSVSKKKKDKSYWGGRFCKVMIPFILANMVYLGFYHDNLTLSLDCVLYLFGIKLINPICWYLQVLVLMYIAFALSERLHPVYKYVMILFLGVVYTLFTKTPGCISWLAFPLGIFVARSSMEIVQWIKSRWYLVIIAFMTSAIFYARNDYHLNTLLSVVNFVCLVTVSPFAFVAVTHNVEVNRALGYLGNHSMEYYLMHYLCLQIILKFNNLSDFTSLLLYLISVPVVSSVFGLICNKTLKK